MEQPYVHDSSYSTPPRWKVKMLRRAVKEDGRKEDEQRNRDKNKIKEINYSFQGWLTKRRQEDGSKRDNGDTPRQATMSLHLSTFSPRGEGNSGQTTHRDRCDRGVEEGRRCNGQLQVWLVKQRKDEKRRREFERWEEDMQRKGHSLYSTS
jgi:hypothetical protein